MKNGNKTIQCTSCTSHSNYVHVLTSQISVHRYKSHNYARYSNIYTSNVICYCKNRLCT